MTNGTPSPSVTPGGLPGATTRVARAAPTITPADGIGLRAEAQRLARYIIGGEPSDAVIERYVRAHDHVLREPPSRADEAVLAFVHARPWSLSLLDAGTAFMRSAPLLRRKLVVMMAIVEATPEHADRTLPIDGVGRSRLAVRLGRAGAVAAVKMVIGAALAVAVTRRPR